MSIPQHYVNEAREKLGEIDDWFSSAIEANPRNAVALVAQRARKIDEQIYESFTNNRVRDYEGKRDVNSLRLRCEAGKGRPFQGVPRSSKSGTVNHDNDDWKYDSHRVQQHSSNRGDDSVSIFEDGTGCKFNIKCTGSAFEDTRRGRGWHEATLLVTFKMTENAIMEEVNSERISLQRELGL